MKKNNNSALVMLKDDNTIEQSNITLNNINELLEQIVDKHQLVSKIKTPKGLVKQKQGFDYVELSYMKNMANEQKNR